MIGMLNSLQLIIHLPLLSMIFPSNVSFFFRLILPIVMFDLLENNNPISKWFPFDQANQVNAEQQISDQVKALGYDSHSSLINLGSLFVFLVLLCVKAIVLLLLRPIVCCFGLGQERYDRWHRSLYFGEIIMIVLEGSMEFLICGYFNFVNPMVTSEFTGEQISLYVAYAIILLTVIITPSVYIWLLN